MDSKVRYPRKISFGLNRGPHRGPLAWEIEPTPQEAEESKKRQADRVLVYWEPLPSEEITAVMDSYRRSLEQMATIAIETPEITSNAKIAEAVGVFESQIQLLVERKCSNLSIEEILKVITACRSVVAFDFGC